tara:strand:+ start:24156 stop:24440 length:285 start_codon:yes stop_codon:yes gene_type:complete
MGERFNRFTNYFVSIGLVTAFVGVNYWSAKCANDAYQKGLNDEQVLQNASIQCISRFGLQHDDLCNLVTSPGVYLVSIARSLEDELEERSWTFK